MSARTRYARSCSVSSVEPAYRSGWDSMPMCAPESARSMHDFLPILGPTEGTCDLQDSDTSLSDSADEGHSCRGGDGKVSRLTASWNRRASRASSARPARRVSSHRTPYRRSSTGTTPFFDAIGESTSATASFEAIVESKGLLCLHKLGDDVQYFSEVSTELSDDDSARRAVPVQDESELGTGSQLLPDSWPQDEATLGARQENLSFEPWRSHYAPPIGAGCETARTVTMRESEAMDSEIVHKLRAGTGLVVLEVGSGPTGRRIRVADEQANVGWISVTSAAGLELVHDARVGGKGWSTAVVGVATSAAALPLMPVRGAAHLADALLRGAANRIGWAGATSEESVEPTGTVEIPEAAASPPSTEETHSALVA